MADANEQLKALDAAFTSRSVIAIRFLVHQTHDLRGRNAAFSHLQRCLPEMLTYFSQCQAFDAATGKAYENAG
eukprot:4691853-Pleurochrysis_carterae.AAC.1